MAENGVFFCILLNMAIYHKLVRRFYITFSITALLLITACMPAVGLTESDLSNAMKNKELKVYVQPVYDLFSGSISSGEALVRWHKDDKVIMPDDFIPAIEKKGTTKDFDLYMIKQVALMQAQRVQNNQKVLPVSVNVSRLTLQQPGVSAEITDIIRTTGADIKMVGLEVTESLRVNDIESMIKNVKELANAGFEILIDDFGSAYSTMLTVKVLPANVLKIDKSILIEDGNTEKAKKILIHTVRLARDINLTVVAEGVETAAQADFLKEIGCNYGQGYFFGKPVIYTKFFEMID